jgi:hypothetical protein
MKVTATAAILFFFVLSDVIAQSPSIDGDSLRNPFFIQSSLHYGFIIPHSSELIPISNSNPVGVELEAGKVLRKRRSYQNCNCYARLGLSLQWMNFQNREVLGDALSLSIFGEPYLSLNPKFYTTFKGAVGVSYLNQVYDPLTNPENLFYSSEISFLLQVALKLNYQLSDHWTLFLSGSYNHISNAGISQPNKGINYPTLSIGATYFPSKFKLTAQTKSLGLKKKKWRKYFWLSGHRKVLESDSLNEESSFINIGLEAGVWRTITNINALTAGVELYFDGSVNNINKRDNENYGPVTVGLSFGHALSFGRFSFTQAMVWYAYRTYPYNDASFYQRYAIHYKVWKGLQLGASLKAHGHVASHMDIRAGFVFK